MNTLILKDSALTNLVYLTRKTLKKVDSDLEFIIRKEGKYIWNPEIPVYSDIEGTRRLK